MISTFCVCKNHQFLGTGRERCILCDCSATTRGAHAVRVLMPGKLFGRSPFSIKGPFFTGNQLQHGPLNESLQQICHIHPNLLCPMTFWNMTTGFDAITSCLVLQRRFAERRISSSCIRSRPAACFTAGPAGHSRWNVRDLQRVNTPVFPLRPAAHRDYTGTTRVE